MKYIQREHPFTTISAAASSTVSSYKMSQKGQILQYFVSAASTLWTIQLFRNNIPEKSLYIEGNLIPLYIDVEQGDEISVKVTNGDSTSQSCVVMILYQEY